MEKYLAVRDQLDTGDIVLFSGRAIIYRFIQGVTRSKWDHVGMVVRCDVGVLLWESDLLINFKDIESGVEGNGVRLVSLSDRLKSFEGEAWVRPLEVERTPEMLEGLSKFRDEVRGREYEKHPIEIIKAYYDGPFGQNTKDLSSLFCSELAAEAYQRMGLLSEPPTGQPSNEYTPIDFSEERDLVLLKGKLGKAIPLKN